MYTTNIPGNCISSKVPVRFIYMHIERKDFLYVNLYVYQKWY